MRGSTTAGFAVALALLAAAPAQAGTLTVAEGDRGIGITYVAAAGETNHLRLYQGESYVRAIDPGHPITAKGVNCEVYHDNNPNVEDPYEGGAICFYVDFGDDPYPADTLIATAVALGDGNDTADAYGSGVFTGGLSGGPGNDTLQGSFNLAGDKGDDLLIPESAHLVAGGGPGNDTIRMPSEVNGSGDDCAIPFGGMPAKVDGGSGHNTLSFANQCFSYDPYHIDPETGRPDPVPRLTLDMTKLARKHRLRNIQTIVGCQCGRGDRITGDRYANTIVDGAGDVVSGGAGNDKLTGQTVDGGAGNDHLTGQAVTGDRGDDTLVAERFAEFVATVLHGGSGNDKLSVKNSHFVNVTLDGGRGDDTVSGGDGDDTVLVGPGKDTYSGGRDGFYYDTISYAKSKHPVKVSQDGEANDGPADEHDNVSGFEVIIGSKYDDTLTGGDAGEILRGLAGNDTLDGGAGQDDLEGGLGDDALDGGAGDDGLNGGSGADVIAGGAGHDRACYSCGTPERKAPVFVSLDGKANDGNAGDNTGQEAGGAHPSQDTEPAPPPEVTILRDNVGSDIEEIRGTDFADRLVGGPGDDTLFGGAGATLLGMAGNDTLQIIEVLYTSEAGTLNGGDGNDTLKGGDGDNELFGGPGDDELTGSVGIDLFNCGPGNDRAVDPASDEKQFGCELQGPA